MADSGMCLAYWLRASARALDPRVNATDAIFEEAAMRRTLTVSILLMGLLAVSLTGCGGGGSSTTGPSGSSGGGSTAAIQGQVVSAQTSRGTESGIVVALRTVLGIGLAEAVTGTPIAGAWSNSSSA